MRAGNGRAGHSSSVSRPGKLRVFAGLPFMVLRLLVVISGLNIKPRDDESLRCRDAPLHPSFAQAKKSQVKKSQAKKRRQENSSLKRREAERR